MPNYTGKECRKKADECRHTAKTTADLQEKAGVSKQPKLGWCSPKRPSRPRPVIECRKRLIVSGADPSAIGHQAHDPLLPTRPRRKHRQSIHPRRLREARPPHLLARYE